MTRGLKSEFLGGGPVTAVVIPNTEWKAVSRNDRDKNAISILSRVSALLNSFGGRRYFTRNRLLAFEDRAI